MGLELILEVNVLAKKISQKISFEHKNYAKYMHFLTGCISIFHIA
jgi:hypothetical protein